MPPSEDFWLLYQALQGLDYVADGEDGGIYTFNAYRNVHTVLLQDIEGVPLETQVDALVAQGIDRERLEEEIQKERKRRGDDAE